MQKQNKETKAYSSKKTYLKYTREMRLELIRLVTQENRPTAEAARLVGIKQTSACRIIDSYCKFNRVFERKADRLGREKNQNCQISENLGMKSQGTVGKQQKEVDMLQKTTVSGSDPKLEVLFGEGRTAQLIISGAYVPPFNTDAQNDWAAFVMTQNGIWSWPYMYPMF